MIVNYYFRNRGSGNYSIENVFNTVGSALKSRIAVNQYFTQAPVDLRSVLAVRTLRADVHHITGAINYLAMGLPGKRTVLTVHDLGHYTETLKGLKKMLYGWFFFRLPFSRVARITAISEFTKQQIVQHFRISPFKITVIPNPVSEKFQFRSRRQNDVPVILQIGQGKHKNLTTLIEAVQGLKVKLLLLRKPDAATEKSLKEKGIDYNFRFDLDDNALVEAYAQADIVFFASTYEGFGLPILEAMAIGRPVITSCISPMKEVAGTAAVLVDPKSTGQVREAILRLIESPALYASHVDQGQKTIEKYKVGKIADQYYDLYTELIRGSA